MHNVSRIDMPSTAGHNDEIEATFKQGIDEIKQTGTW